MTAGKTAFGESSPAIPALHRPEPLSITTAGLSDMVSCSVFHARERLFLSLRLFYRARLGPESPVTNSAVNGISMAAKPATIPAIRPTRTPRAQQHTATRTPHRGWQSRAARRAPCVGGHVRARAAGRTPARSIAPRGCGARPISFTAPA